MQSLISFAILSGSSLGLEIGILLMLAHFQFGATFVLKSAALRRLDTTFAINLRSSVNKMLALFYFALALKRQNAILINEPLVW